MNKLIIPHVDSIRERALPEGGFAARKDGKYRPDATAWAILALSASGIKADSLMSSRYAVISVSRIPCPAK